MTRNSLYILLTMSCLSLLPSCFEDEMEDERIVVNDQGDDRREGAKNPYLDDDDDDDDDDDNNDDPDKPNPPQNDFDFTSLSGVYNGELLSPDPDEEPSILDVTAKANSDMTFDLALYNAVVSGIELGDLIFTSIPAQYKETEDSWTFSLKKQEVTLLGGAISAMVDVDGKVDKKGELQFSVKIDEPELTLNYKGKKGNGNNSSFSFTSLSSIYAGNLLSPDPEEEPSPLDVTVKANEDKTFDLALYDAVVSGIELGDLIFNGIPSKEKTANEEWTFSLRGKEVSLLGGVIQAKVDVDGTINKSGTLKFSVTIDEPNLTLRYEGKKK